MNIAIAMNIAEERWWRDPRYLLAPIANPSSLEQMDRTIPYKLPSDQVLAFYVQSAVIVQCLLQARNGARPTCSLGYARESRGRAHR